MSPHRETRTADSEISASPLLILPPSSFSLVPHERAMTINGHWVHNLPKFVPLLPHTEQIGVRYYGLAYVLGFVGSIWLLMRYARKGRTLIPKQDVMDLLFMLMLGVFIGGR